MKKIATYMMLGVMALSASLSSCDDEDGIAPSVDLSTFNFTHEPGAGEITLKWTAPANVETAGFAYLKMSYTDPRDHKTRVKTISPYASELVIPNTRARYGEAYSFTFTPYSSTDTPGVPFVLEKCRSNAAPATTTVARGEKITLKELTTNSQEPSEGPLANLTNGKTNDFFHTIWSKDKPERSWVDIDLGEELTRFEIHTWNRNTNGSPQNVKLYRLSKLGDTSVNMATDAIMTYRHPNTAPGAECGVLCPVQNEPDFDKPVRYLRYCGCEGHGFWNMAELAIYKMVVNKYDPETDEPEAHQN